MYFAIRAHLRLLFIVNYLEHFNNKRGINLKITSESFSLSDHDRETISESIVTRLWQPIKKSVGRTMHFSRDTFQRGKL